MKISDEIRSWCETYCGCKIGLGVCDELRWLADRIDREMVRLPKDADGVPIHVGDTVYGCRSGMKMTISELRMTMDKWFISTSRGYLTDTTITHVIPDSWEHIADELDEMVDSADSADDSCERLAYLAERIRKLAEKEDE